MTLLKGLLKGLGVKVKDKSFHDLFHHVHWHCYWFHPEGRTILNYMKCGKKGQELYEGHNKEVT
jgi:hypothetical protein